VTGTFGVIGVLALLGLLLGYHGPAKAADRSYPMQLSNEQLDRVSAAAMDTRTYYASAVGNSDATGGASARTAVNVISIAGMGGPVNSAASGAVSASATSSPGSMATASSSLSLFVTNP